MIAERNDKRRVEMKYRAQHNVKDAIVVTREVITYPVNSHGVQWSKRESKEDDLYV